MTLILGKRLPAGHPLTRNIIESVDTIIENTPVLDMINYSPTLRRILELLGFEKGYNLLHDMKEFSKVIS